jgi:hypothetical protein
LGISVQGSSSWPPLHPYGEAPCALLWLRHWHMALQIGGDGVCITHQILRTSWAETMCYLSLDCQNLTHSRLSRNMFWMNEQMHKWMHTLTHVLFIHYIV